MKKTTLALIGAGKWGQNYLHAAATLKNVEIKYICAQSQQTLNLLPDKYIKTLAINTLLKNKQIYGFIIATPASTHFTIAKQLLSLGRNVLIEKPLATNYIQALSLQKIWQRKKTKVLIGHIYIYSSAFQKCKKLANNIGAIKSVNFEGLISPPRDVSVIWDWGPHPISLMIDLIKKPIKSVRAESFTKKLGSKLPDTLKAEIVFSNNIIGIINTSWYGFKKVRRLTIQGKNKTIIFDDTNEENKISIYKSNTLINNPKYHDKKPLTSELEEFVLSISQNKSIVSNINFGVEVVKVLSAIEKSSKKGGEIVYLY